MEGQLKNERLLAGLYARLEGRMQDARRKRRRELKERSIAVLKETQEEVLVRYEDVLYPARIVGVRKDLMVDVTIRRKFKDPLKEYAVEPWAIIANNEEQKKVKTPVKPHAQAQQAK